MRKKDKNTRSKKLQFTVLVTAAFAAALIVLLILIWVLIL